MESSVNERRKHKRVATKILIKYSSADQFFTDYIQNISRGGIFVPTHNPLPQGTRLQISFSLPYCEELITTGGIVVRSIHADPQSGLSPSGMGIQFQRLTSENLRLIDTYVESLLV
jgi:uncharacterized protein (TIGR02266 family)